MSLWKSISGHVWWSASWAADFIPAKAGVGIDSLLLTHPFIQKPSALISSKWYWIAMSEVEVVFSSVLPSLKGQLPAGSSQTS